MKEYVKPELEYVNFASEAVTDTIMSTEEGNTGGGL